jgi:CheY-like chemotaxis protein
MMKRILICDDHPLFADVIAKRLIELKYEVRLVNDKNSYIKILTT